MCWSEKDRKGPKTRTHYACCFCKTELPRQSFVASMSAQMRSDQRTDNARIDGDAMERYCRRHGIRTYWVHKGKEVNPRERIRWIDMRYLTCLHCQHQVREEDGRTTGCDWCQCDTSPRAKLPVHTRLGPSPRSDEDLKIECIERWWYRPIVLIKEKHRKDR